MWRYKGDKRIEKVVDQEQALKDLRQYAKNARNDAISYIEEQLKRFEKELVSNH